MSAELDAVLAAYYRAGAVRTRAGLLWDLRGGNRTELAHAAYVVANEGLYGERGMPIGTFRERIAAQQALLERIAPEIAAMEAEADASHFVGRSSGERVAAARQHA
jgi:hypothetical protein